MHAGTVITISQYGPFHENQQSTDMHVTDQAV